MNGQFDGRFTRIRDELTCTGFKVNLALDIPSFKCRQGPVSAVKLKCRMLRGGFLSLKGKIIGVKARFRQIQVAHTVQSRSIQGQCARQFTFPIVQPNRIPLRGHFQALTMGVKVDVATGCVRGRDI